ncbi:MAG: thioredoxin family protein [Alphaproteobacteria bacterium]|nr:thioredoxin family protein [Alphaproteobacteria bacterium]
MTTHTPFGKIRLFGAVLALSALASNPVLSAENKLKGVVELFTSQGCSSCPPADAVLGELASEGEVVALAYHVDYWNYLGWRDTFSSEQSTKRQYDYARTLGRKSVYTPQAVINGRDHLNGADRRGIDAKLDGFEQAGRGLVVPVEAVRDGDSIKINIGSGDGKANILLVYFDRENTVDVKRGENRGRKLTYWNSVKDMQTVAMWDGEAMELVLPKSLMDADGHEGCAILLQTMKSNGVPGPIVGAGILMNESS